MLWFFIGNIFFVLLSLVRVSRLSKSDKDLEFIILRHQLDAMVRKQKKPRRLNRAEKATLALLTARLKKNTKRTIRQLRMLSESPDQKQSFAGIENWYDVSGRNRQRGK